MHLIGPPPKPAHFTHSAPPPAAQDGLRAGAKLWLVRHAEVEERWHEIAYGAMDVALSPNGRAATEAMGHAFEAVDVTRVIASDLERAAELGVGIAAASSAPIAHDARLREMHRGSWQGRTKTDFRVLWDAEAENYWRDPYRWHVPDGEGDELIFERSWPAIHDGLAAVEGGTLVVAAHGQLIRVITGRLLGSGSPESYAYAPEPAHAHLLLDAPDGWSLEAQNVGPEGVR
jgi:broad specificity phosphatase PhoE